MLYNIAKISLIILMLASISAAYSDQQRAVSTHANTITTNVSSMVLAKGQYIIDSRNYKPGVDCCIC